MKQKMFIFFMVAVVATLATFLLFDKPEQSPISGPTAETSIRLGDRYAANAYSWESGVSVSCIIVQGAPMKVVSVEKSTVRVAYDGQRSSEPYCKPGDLLEVSKQKILNSTRILFSS